MKLLEIQLIPVAKKIIPLSKIFADAEQQTKLMLAEIPKAKDGNANLVSPRTLESDQLKLVPSKDWTSGFFPGELWFLYEYTKKKEWKMRRKNLLPILKKKKQMAVPMIWASRFITALAMVIN